MKDAEIDEKIAEMEALVRRLDRVESSLTSKWDVLERLLAPPMEDEAAEVGSWEEWKERRR